MESKPPCDISIQHKSETKNTRTFKFKQLQKSSPNCKKIFKKNGETFPLAGRLKYDSTIQSIFKGYSMDFVETHHQTKSPVKENLNQVEEEVVSQEVKNMLEKSVIRKVVHVKNLFISNLLLLSKKDGGQRQVFNLKELNTFISYKHFKMQAPHVKRNFGARRLSMQVGPQRRLFLRSIEQTVKEICTL